MTDALPRAYGGPALHATLRAQPEDFRVEEILGFEPTGEGEHAFVLVEKTGANTEWVARQLAARLDIPAAAIGFAGMKDRHAITRQTFSVQLPGRADPDWSHLDIEGVQVLFATRHNRKLKRGAHRGNRFEIRLHDVQGDIDAARGIVERIRTGGFPNYYGEQRFGNDGRNLALARAVFAGRRIPRHQRGIAISSARSALFNAVLARRVAAGNWNTPIDGEVCMLDGTHSIFGPQPIDAELESRSTRMDVHPTGPLWGAGALRSSGDAAVREHEVASSFADLASGLEKIDLRQERRALRMRCDDLVFDDDANNACVLRFTLPSGCYATALLREICEWHGDLAPNG